jgi:hypothetical protein
MAEFINVSVWHGSLDRAQEILAEHPDVASSDIHTAAVLGDHEASAARRSRPSATTAGPRCVSHSFAWSSNRNGRRTSSRCLSPKR